MIPSRPNPFALPRTLLGAGEAVLNLMLSVAAPVSLVVFAALTFQRG